MLILLRCGLEPIPGPPEGSLSARTRWGSPYRGTRRSGAGIDVGVAVLTVSSVAVIVVVIFAINSR